MKTLFDFDIHWHGNSWRRLLAITALFGSLTSLAGCGEGGSVWEKVTVEGAVTFDGKKVLNGDIRFVPALASTGPTVGAEVIDGHFKVTNKGGVPVGTHRVMLRAFNIEGVGPVSDGSGSDDLFGGAQAKRKSRTKRSIPTYMVEGYAQYLPPPYNTEMALEIVVTGEGNPQIEDFMMKSL